jgi:MFS family permease
LQGFSVGINQAMLMTYISEIAPSQGRGALLANYTIWWGIGGFCAQITLKILNGMPISQWRHGIYSEWVFTG